MTADPPAPTPPRRPDLLARIRGLANVTAGVLAIVVLVGFALGPGHIPTRILGRVGAIAVFAFVVGFVAILIENRRNDEPEDEF